MLLAPGRPGLGLGRDLPAVLTGLNALSAKAFGESEFWLALIKVITVIALPVAGVLMIFGILGDNSPG